MPRSFNQQTFTDKYVEGAGTVTLSSNSYEGKQSFCVSKTFSETNGVTSIFDLARPEIAKLMDSDGNGKGEIWIGAPGWASANVNEVKVRDYGLMPFMDPIRADQAVHAIWFQHDIVRLEEPAFDPEKYVALQPSDDPDWFNKSKVQTEDAIKNVQIAFSNSLADRSPAIADLLANIALVAANGDRVDSWLGL